MSTKRSQLAALALVSVIALGCGDSSDSKETDAGSTSNAGTNGGNSGSSGTGSGNGGVSGMGGEPSITCLGSSMCEADQVCCGQLATMSTGCETGSACPAMQTQLCADAADCGGAACQKFTVMGIELGICGGSGSAGTGAAGDGGDDAGVN